MDKYFGGVNPKRLSLCLSGDRNMKSPAITCRWSRDSWQHKLLSRPSAEDASHWLPAS